ncbi:hypothetical protein ACIQM4_17655 [Streptomyces sp. NPDC091272]|uniref:hypothetical protein n=1 Tax=Streptomyces sp. NPDC091272 TaxID=3365981 RepID=UPI0037FBDBFC
MRRDRVTDRTKTAGKPRNRLRTGASVATAVLTLTAVGACDGNEPRPGPGGTSAAPGPSDGRAAAAVRDAYRKTLDAGSARMVLRVQTTADGRATAVDGEGVVDLARGSSVLTLSAEGEKVEQRVVERIVYQKVPAARRAAVPGKKPWIRIDPSKAAPQQGGGQVGDPAGLTALARGVTGEGVRELGAERIGDTDTTHYRASVDVSRLPDGARLRKQIGPTLPVDLWLDDAHRIARQQTDMTFTAPEGTGADSTTPKKLSVRTVFELSDFGTKAEVKAPPAAGTADLTDDAGRRR